MYRILDNPRPASHLGAWRALAGEFADVVGWLSLRDILLRNPENGGYALLRVGRPCVVPLKFHDADAFWEGFLAPETLPLRADHVDELEGRLGKLGPEELYVPVPDVRPSRLSPAVHHREDVWMWAARAAKYYDVGKGGVVDAVLPHFDLYDDLDLWRAVVGHASAELQGDGSALVQIGCCSHWLRPHQSRWTADGGFAWPTGYGSGQGGHSSISLPAFDWSVTMTRAADGRLELARDKSARPALRIAVPARTYVHRQAAIHTVWSTGREKEVRFYGFRKLGGEWRCTAESDWAEDRPKGPRRAGRLRRRPL